MALEADIQCSARAGPSVNAVFSCASILQVWALIRCSSIGSL